MKITSTLISEPVEYKCFTIKLESDGLTNHISIFNPLNLYGNEYSIGDVLNPKKEWNNMYDAILNNEEYRLDINQNKTSLMINCFEGKILFSAIPNVSYHNMIDISLSVNEHKDELLKVFKSLMDILDMFPDRKDSDFICKKKMDYTQL